HRGLAGCEIFAVGNDGVGKVSVGLDAIEEFRVPFAVKRPRLVGDTRRRLSLLPLPPINGEHPFAIVVLDTPNAYYRHEGLRFGAASFARENDRCWLGREPR